MIPIVPTRKGLLIIDLQNDFISPDGPLYTQQPEGWVNRVLDLVKAFRDTQSGDVIWVRSEFRKNRPLVDGDRVIQIITSLEALHEAAETSRGRSPVSVVHDIAITEKDKEAFLTPEVEIPEGEEPKTPVVVPGTEGAQFAPEVQATIDRRDIIFTKTHYSAFAEGPLLQTLRRRFVTTFYVCGALTNVSIYATALDAAQHGFQMTIVDDCCGYRDAGRHRAAVNKLVQVTGSDVVTYAELIEQFRPPAPPTLSSGLSPSISNIEIGSSSAALSGVPADAIPKVSSSEAESSELRPKGQLPPPKLRPGELEPQAASPPHAPEEDRDERKQSDDQPWPQPASRSPQPNLLEDRVALRPLDDQGAVIKDTSSARPADANRVTCDDESTSPRDSPRQKLAESARSTENHLQNGDATARRHPESESPKGPTQAPGAANTKTEKPRVRLQQRGEKTRIVICQKFDVDDDKKTSSTPSASKPDTDASTTVHADRIDQESSSKSLDPSSIESVTRATAELKLSDLTTLPPEITSTPSSKTTPTHSQQPSPTMADQPTVTSSEPLCEGDTTIFYNVLPSELADIAFGKLLEEVSWAGMSHMGGEVPRRVAVQGEVAPDGSMPVYRHPNDESPPLLPFTPTVRKIKEVAEKIVGHPLNHVLIQHYRNGNDYISEHSDKTLDIVQGTYVTNVSLGAQRTMVFRTKRPLKDKDKDGKPDDDHDNNSNDEKKAPAGSKRQIQRAPLPHNSLMRMGLKTNERWLHAIRQDKRADRDKSPAELAYSGARISLTFRHIGTYIDASQTLIWGQGATGKTREEAKPVKNGLTDEAVAMLKVFGTENHSSEFDWQEWYGKGFDVLHMGVPKRFCVGAKDGAVGNASVLLALGELGVSCAKGSVEGVCRFEENDVSRAVVEGVGTVLRYLDAVYGKGRRYDQLLPGEVAKRFTLLAKAEGLAVRWKEVGSMLGKGGVSKDVVRALMKKELEEWEGVAGEAVSSEFGEGLYICGGVQASPADFGLWPVLHDMVRACGGDEGLLGGESGFLRKYYVAFRGRGSAAKALELWKE